MRLYGCCGSIMVAIYLALDAHSTFVGVPLPLAVPWWWADAIMSGLWALTAVRFVVGWRV